MRHYKKLLRSLFVLACVPWLAAAKVPELEPLNYETRYDITFGGFAIGRLRINFAEDKFGYGMRVDTKTSGLVEIFAPMRSVAHTRGRITEEGQYVPQRYRSAAERDGDEKDRTAILLYDKQGLITSRERVPPISLDGYRPIVPLEKLAPPVTDPITGFFAIRKLLRDHMASNDRTAEVMTYDTVRLATMQLKVISKARVKANGKYHDAINTVLTRQPLDGYTRKELKKFKEGDPVVHAYFSADGRLLPLAITVSLPLGTLRAELVELKESSQSPSAF